MKIEFTIFVKKDKFVDNFHKKSVKSIEGRGRGKHWLEGESLDKRHKMIDTEDIDQSSQNFVNLFTKNCVIFYFVWSSNI